MSQQVIELDASMFAGRIRRPVSRPVVPVESRGKATYLRKHPLAEVWAPDDVRVKIVASKSAQKTTPKRADEEQILLSAPVAPAEKTIDFVSRAAQWNLEAAKMADGVRSSLTQKLLVAMAVTVFLAGMTVSFRAFLTNRKVVQTVSAQSSKASGLVGLQENQPTDEEVRNYRVAPSMPRIISIPQLGVKGRIKPVGVDNTNRMQSPTSIFDAGWYKDTVLPGSNGGVSVINGHVSGPTTSGIFSRLKELKPGSEIQIERGDGTAFTYRVVKSKSYAASTMNMAEAMVPVNTAKHGLNLITCTGSVDSSGRHYTDRLVVFAELAS